MLDTAKGEITIGYPILKIGLLVHGNKDTLIDYLRAATAGLKFDYALILQSPHGKKYFYKTFEEIPATDVPCECGFADHWLIKYRIKELANARS